MSTKPPFSSTAFSLAKRTLEQEAWVALADYVTNHVLEGEERHLKKLAEADPHAVISSEKRDRRRLDAAFESLPPEVRIRLKHHHTEEEDGWEGDEVQWFATHPPPVPRTYHLVITSQGRKLLKEAGVEVEEAKSTAQRGM